MPKLEMFCYCLVFLPTGLMTDFNRVTDFDHQPRSMNEKISELQVTLRKNRFRIILESKATFHLGPSMWQKLSSQ